MRRELVIRIELWDQSHTDDVLFDANLVDLLGAGAYLLCEVCA
jgi:hypothetical protein